MPPASFPPPSFAQILGSFPDLTLLARALGLPYPTVAAWKRRDRIPEIRWRSIAAAAKELKVKGVTYATLSAASRARAGADVDHPRAQPQGD